MVYLFLKKTVVSQETIHALVKVTFQPHLLSPAEFSLCERYEVLALRVSLERLDLLRSDVMTTNSSAHPRHISKTDV